MSSQPESDASALVESVVDKYADELIDLRRDLHAHPELSWHERRTTDVVADRLGGLGLEVTRLPASSAQGTRSGTGLVAEVGNEGPVVALVVGVALASAGCASSAAEVVRDTAAAQWGCPAAQIAVDDRGAGHFDASGCGRRGRYATHPSAECPSPGCPGTSQGI